MSRKPRKAKSRRRRRLVAIVVGLVVGAVGFEIATWPRAEELATQNPQSTAFFDRARQEARSSNQPDPQMTWMPYERISIQLKYAVLVAEDIEFLSHDGFAWEELETAVRETVEEGKKLRGASTLTQQLAKNLWLSPSRDPLRKVREAILTRQLETSLEKRRLLELYLNVVEFGPGRFGAEAAAREYFGVPASRLDARQAAALAAALPHSRWHPGADSQAYRAHVARVAGRMDKATWLLKELRALE